VKKSHSVTGNIEQPPVQQESELQTAELTQLLIESMQDYAIIFLDTGGLVITWSPAAEGLKIWKAREIIGQHFSRFYTEEDVAAGKPQIELDVATKEGRSEDESWRVRKDGTRFWANVVTTALKDKNGAFKGFGQVTRDLTERRANEERIKKQAMEIMEMATVPIVQVWEGVVLAPLIGALDSQRTQQLMERLLHRITETASPVALLDITGVPTIDSQTAQHLIETISAVRLLGAEVILTGVRPTIAQTLVHLGIDLSNVMTRSSLSAGILVALNTLGLSVTPKGATA
jgi:PAS domain S-box-containing protein